MPKNELAHIHPNLIESGNVFGIDHTILNKSAFLCQITYDEERKRRNIPVTIDFKHDVQDFDNFYGQNGTLGDVAGIVHYDPLSHILYVVFRGSLKDDNLSYIKDEDWKRNLQIIKTQPQEFELNLSGQYHHGFLRKYSECLDNKDYQGKVHTGLHDVLKKYFDFFQESLPRVVISGHSLGAALAQIAVIDMCQNIIPKMVPAFDNTQSNTVVCIAFSAPRVIGNPETLQNAHNCVGKMNIVRVNMEHDPVPNGLPGKNMTNLLINCLATDEKSRTNLEKITGYQDFGCLALMSSKIATDKNKEAIQKAAKEIVKELRIGKI